MKHFTIAALFILALTCSAQEPTELTDSLGNVFHLTTVTDKVPSARQMALTKSGVLFVGSRGRGSLYAVVPSDETATEPEVVTFETGLAMPTGLALHGDDLYVAAHNRILKYENIEETYRSSPEPKVVNESLPRARAHGWKYLSVGPDGFLYFNVGAPCNICLSEDEIFASIVRMDPSNGEFEIYAHGVRNSVGIDWHPETNQMWFSDNGRDWWGDDRPPEEINVVEKPGSHFGYPFLHGDNLVDPEFGSQRQEEVDYKTPVVNIQAHAAALGLDFYTANAFPANYQNALFIAEHGSWNRSAKVGYRVSVVRFDEDEPTYYPFVDIWLDGQRSNARPNDVLVDNDGNLLISDDFRGAIYKVVHVPDEVD
ncbi:MAG: PQQ-dependent sugar dehydrogenase [Gammaproteobacteria bacterium]|nr:PQQ-dependent sugar dehydrogenase [Gammaproteobacteria bacterium]